VRLNSTRSKSPSAIEHDSDPIDINRAPSHKKSSLPFAYRKESDAFGQIVKSEQHELDDSGYESKIKVISREDYLAQMLERSPYRDEDGNLIRGTNAEEARLHPTTLQARNPRDQVKIPPLISKAIDSHILALRLPKRLRTAISDAYVALYKNEIHKPSTSSMEADAHIGGLFIQNYASIYQVLSELKKRVKDFNPQSVLDVGFGPATGMLVLNEIMGDEFKPQVKDALIVGDKSMKDRAKILLSRQVNEYTGDVKDLEVDLQETAQEDAAEAIEDVEENQIESEVFQDKIDEKIGAIKTNQIKVKTKLRDYLSPTKKYELIIATHQMLQDASRFPYQVDENVDILLQSLAPNGHLVLVERGNPLGFEIIARARQVMVRPERFNNENGKVPRPYTKNSNTKGKNKANLGKLSEQIDNDTLFLQQMQEKYGDPSKEELKLDTENLKDAEIVQLQEMTQKYEEKLASEQQSNVEPYHLSILAPCPHHHKCPLQTLKPSYYKTPTGRRFEWCHFEKSVERPPFAMEVKRGKVLSQKWSSKESGRAEKGIAGSGRQDAKNFELASYSYLITHRSPIDEETVSAIEASRDQATCDDLTGTEGSSEADWPRILLPPMKRTGHITMAVCGASGKFEKWVIAKSQTAVLEGQIDEETGMEKTHQLFYDARKSSVGDLWAFGAKTKTGMPSLNSEKVDKIENYLKNEAARDAKSKREHAKLEKLKLAEKAKAVEGGDVTIEEKLDVFAETFDKTKKQIQDDKKSLRPKRRK